jgi:hypothetical protein
MLLDAADLQSLTGFIRPSKQIEWLQREGFTFRVAADGHPRVDRAHYLKMMGVTDLAAKRRTAPDFSTLRA